MIFGIDLVNLFIWRD